jgi:uncharacterized protein (DUF488 family)
MPRTLLTIGHSSHTAEAFVDLLKRHGVTAVADVRSTPFSRRHPQFDRGTLRRTLAAHEIAYAFLGVELGARPTDPECYVGEQASYERIAATELFAEGLARLRRGIASHRVAVMCAEGEPIECHRMILVCRHVRGPGLAIEHILADGRLEPNVETEARLVKRTRAAQGRLFEGDDPVERAYAIQAERIAYRRPHVHTPPGAAKTSGSR